MEQKLESDVAPAVEAPLASEVVSARQVAKRYGRTWALRGVDIGVRRGEMVCVLGPNGSGKSTLLRIVSTATRPTHGELLVLGQARVKRESILSRIGVLSPRPFTYDNLTARENLRFAADMYGLADGDSRIGRSLDAVGLADVADAQVATYSSGMRKRLALARATLHDPELVLLDEPYAALDAEGVGWVDRFVDRLREAGKTALIATHEHGRARRLCDRAVGLDRGRVVYDGPAEGYRAAGG